MTRVYVPTTGSRIRAARDADRFEPGPDVVLAPGDDEESEYAALMTAAGASADLAAAEGGSGRRLVLVAEIGDADPAEQIPWRLVVAVQADAVGRDWADPAVDRDEDLGWYGTQELDSLL